MTEPSQPDTPPEVPGGQPWVPGTPAPPFTPPGAPGWPSSAPTSPPGMPFSPTGAPGWPSAPPASPPGPPAQVPGRGRGLRVTGWVLVLVAFVGGVAMFGFGLYRALGSVSDMQRVPASNGGQVTIDDPGVYTIYYEPAQLARSDQDDSGPGLPSVQAVGPDGMVAATTPPDGEFSYSFGDRTGHKLAELHADLPGRYWIEPLSSDTLTGELAVGGNLGGWLVAAFVGAGVGILVFLVGLVLLIIGYVQRRPRAGMVGG